MLLETSKIEGFFNTVFQLDYLSFMIVFSRIFGSQLNSLMEGKGRILNAEICLKTYLLRPDLVVILQVQIIQSKASMCLLILDRREMLLIDHEMLGTFLIFILTNVLTRDSIRGSYLLWKV